MRCSLYVLICLNCLSALAPGVTAASGVTEVPVSANALIYDSFTDKLYASATNNLLQLDPLTGQILNSFYLGTNVTLLSPGADHGIWTAVDDGQAVRRFDLGTLSAEDKIAVPVLGRGIFDLYGSPTDPNLAVLSIVDNNQIGSAFVVRNGSVLPNSQRFVDFVAIQGVSIYDSYQNTSYRMALGAAGVSAFITSTPLGGALRPFGSYIYCRDGSVRDVNSLAVVADLGTGPGYITINTAENTVYQLAYVNPVLSVFTHPGLQKISSTDLTPGSNQRRSMARRLSQACSLSHRIKLDHRGFGSIFRRRAFGEPRSDPERTRTR